MDLIKLPKAFLSWIILYDSLCCNRDMQVFIKILIDYSPIIPAYKVEEICNIAVANLQEQEFQRVIDILWKTVTNRRDTDGEEIFYT